MATPRKTKSSLVDHRFPAFYACYLLKSIRTPQISATYIGSTPDPPRRLRQHNGEISAGAWKTKHNRPWVMTMIVHGFPSRLAALQFEWAWQHPHISRHLKDADGKRIAVAGKRSSSFKVNIQTLYKMVSTNPWSLWPLHVKLFTEEAAKGWAAAEKSCPGFGPPAGFTCTLELEGVDGKTGVCGSGRAGPISVTDERFTSQYLSKTTSLLSRRNSSSCSVCREPLTTLSSDPLATTLCPTTHCTSVAHLSCLAKDFLRESNDNSGVGAVVPRGGQCRDCQEYVLWGDVIRGCYRRYAGGTSIEADPETELSSDDEVPCSPVRARSPGPSKLRAKKAVPKTTEASSVEESGPNRRGRSRSKSPITDPSKEIERKRKGRVRSKSPTPAATKPGKRAQAAKIQDLFQDPSTSSRGASPLMKKQPQLELSFPARKGPAAVATASKTKPVRKRTFVTAAARPADDEGEFFDLNNISSDEEEDEVPPAPVF